MRPLTSNLVKLEIKPDARFSFVIIDSSHVWEMFAARDSLDANNCKPILWDLSMLLIGGVN